jgi:hypothetical protein
MLQLLPYALAAYGGIQGYRGARDAGVGGLGSLVQGALGAYTGYNLGQVGGFAKGAGFGNAASSSFVPSFTQTSLGSSLRGMIPGMGPTQSLIQGATSPNMSPIEMAKQGITQSTGKMKTTEGGSLLDLLRNKDAAGNITKGYDPLKVGGSLAALTYLGGAFDPTPTDVYTPGYNTNYLETREKRSFSYIDPVTGEEKEYKKVYVPEQNPNDPGMMMNTTRLKTGGLAEIKKFNEGGINYLPSKTTHDEDDSNNYVRASGYVEDGAGVGDKDEDTMLAQLADGEFVTRADGVLGAGIIAGANPNSMKDMREKGAAYFYEQQKRYKRVFDLLKEANGNSKQKTN